MGSRLYVGNLSYDTTSVILEQLFAQHGSIQSARVIANHNTGRSRGFGFVEMSSAIEAKVAMNALNGTEHNGQSLLVHKAANFIF